MEKLSDKQKLVLDKLKEYTAANGYQPSNQELAEMVGLQSRSTLHGHLRRLEAKGYIEIVGVRAIKILDKEGDSVAQESNTADGGTAAEEAQV